jgi:hypothetical protein
LVDVIQTGSSVARADDWIRTSMDLFTRQVPFSVEPHRHKMSKRHKLRCAVRAIQWRILRESRRTGVSNEWHLVNRK